MCNGCAKWAFTLGPLHINVDPLVVTGTVGKLIDTFLVHGEPVGDSQLLPDLRERCSPA